MSKANVFAIILVYGFISSTLTIDKIICHTKTTIVLWKTLEQNYAYAKEKK